MAIHLPGGRARRRPTTLSHSHPQGRRLPLGRFPGRGWRPSLTLRRRLIQAGLVLVVLGILTSVAAVAWVSQDLPDPNKLNTRVVAESTKIYARDGTTVLYEIHGDQRRTQVRLSDIRPDTIHAVLAIEDKDFYKHSGVSIRGIFRSVWVDLTHGTTAQGGSTITQQLVKNSILTPQKSFTRKVKEVILAYQLEQRFTKEQILKLYFNEIPWGSSAYGVEAAAQTYFGKHAKDLDLAESALLAAMVQRPSHYSPTGPHRDDLVARQRLVLNLMVDQGYITRAQAASAKDIDVLKRISPSRDPIIAPHFVFYVRDLLVQKYGDVAVERGGLRVVTTLDPRLQKIAEEEVAAGAAKNEKKYGANNAALVATDPKTGQVLAMVGSRDFFDTEHDGNFNVATAVRNPGSSFKPFVYLTAFTKGYSPDTLMFDLVTNFGPDGSGKDFVPKNYDFKEHGPVKMRQALAGSLNIPAVKTLYLAGIPQVLDLADQVGYTTFDRSRVGLALAIGGGGVKLLEHVGAFGVLANDGLRDPLTPILRIEDKNGKVLEQYKKGEVRAVDQQNVRQVNSVLTDNNSRAFVFGSHSPLILSDRPVAAKTGTTNDFKDGWTMGFTPSLAAGVWVGNNDNSPFKPGSDGVVVAAPIWHNFMQRALQGKPVEKFPGPKPATESKPVLQGKLQADTPVYIDSQTGQRIPDACLAAWPPQFVKAVKIKEVHDILFYLDKDDPNGAPPSNPGSDPMFSRWEGPVQAWAKKNNFLAAAPPYEDCSLRANPAGPSVAISNPLTNSTISTATVPVSVSVSSPAGVVSVQYSIDGQVLATVQVAPFDALLDVSSMSNGFHSLRATVTDGSGATSFNEISVNILSDKTAPTAYFISPKSRATFSQSSFPQEVQVFAYDPDGVASVTLSMKSADGTSTVLDAVDRPADNTVSLSWPTTPPGSYQLYVTVKSKKGRMTQSDYLPVTVTK